MELTEAQWVVIKPLLISGKADQANAAGRVGMTGWCLKAYSGC